MELHGESDVFIGKGGDKCRRYSGLVEKPFLLQLPEEGKGVRRSTRRRATIHSYENISTGRGTFTEDCKAESQSSADNLQNANIKYSLRSSAASYENFNKNTATMSGKCFRKEPMITDKSVLTNRENHEIPSTYSKKNQENMYVLPFAEESSSMNEVVKNNNSSDLEIQVFDKKKEKIRRKNCDSVDLNRTFIIEPDEENQTSSLQLDKIPVKSNKRYSLRSHFDQSDFNKNNSELCEKTQAFEIPPYQSRRHKLGSSSDGFEMNAKKNEKFVAIRGNNKENFEVSPSTESKMSTRSEKIIRQLQLKDGKSVNVDFDEYFSNITLEEAILMRNRLMETWVWSHVNIKLDNNRRSKNHIKTPDLNKAFILSTSQELEFESDAKPTEENQCIESEINVERISILKNKCDCLCKRGGRKKGNQPEQLKKSHLKKKLKRCSSTLETIFEIPKEDNLMSVRKFKRSISFDNFSSEKTRKRTLKAKKLNGFVQRETVDNAKLDEILNKLDLSEYTE